SLFLDPASEERIFKLAKVGDIFSVKKANESEPIFDLNYRSRSDEKTKTKRFDFSSEGRVLVSDDSGFSRCSTEIIFSLVAQLREIVKIEAKHLIDCDRMERVRLISSAKILQNTLSRLSWCGDRNSVGVDKKQNGKGEIFYEIISALGENKTVSFDENGLAFIQSPQEKLPKLLDQNELDQLIKMLSLDEKMLDEMVAREVRNQQDLRNAFLGMFPPQGASKPYLLDDYSSVSVLYLEKEGATKYTKQIQGLRISFVFREGQRVERLEGEARVRFGENDIHTDLEILNHQIEGSKARKLELIGKYLAKIEEKKDLLHLLPPILGAKNGLESNVFSFDEEGISVSLFENRASLFLKTEITPLPYHYALAEKRLRKIFAAIEKLEIDRKAAEKYLENSKKFSKIASLISRRRAMKLETSSKTTIILDENGGAGYLKNAHEQMPKEEKIKSEEDEFVQSQQQKKSEEEIKILKITSEPEVNLEQESGALGSKEKVKNSDLVFEANAPISDATSTRISARRNVEFALIKAFKSSYAEFVEEIGKSVDEKIILEGLVKSQFVILYKGRDNFFTFKHSNGDSKDFSWNEEGALSVKRSFGDCDISRVLLIRDLENIRQIFEGHSRGDFNDQ
ncbi:MAG: hypothetical protein KGP29_05320, partial [Proteobacteria bacterium]|nr:hypothetical protein [Pseudomonadota bacterium]